MTVIAATSPTELIMACGKPAQQATICETQQSQSAQARRNRHARVGRFPTASSSQSGVRPGTTRPITTRHVTALTRASVSTVASPLYNTRSRFVPNHGRAPTGPRRDPADLTSPPQDSESTPWYPRAGAAAAASPAPVPVIAAAEAAVWRRAWRSSLSASPGSGRHISLRASYRRLCKHSNPSRHALSSATRLRP